MLLGQISLPEGFDPAGRQVEVDIGGVKQVLELDARGRGRSGTASFLVKTRSKRRGLFKVRLRRGDYAASWADEGVADRDISRASIRIPVRLVVDGSPYAGEIVGVYTAKAGKGGIAKTSRRR
jgi:hypothetical protein